MSCRLLMSLTIVLGFQLPVAGEVLRIPSDSGIREFQRILDSAAYGDTVLVAPGEYHQVIMRSGIYFASETGPEDTIISNSRFWVVKADGTDSLAVVDGFTLDGKGAADGIVHAENAQLIVRNCVIRGGWSGIRSMYSDVRVENCTISKCQNGCYFFESEGSVLSNEITHCINGISIVSSAPKIQRNLIATNTLGISVSRHSEPSIGGSLATANRIYNNQSGFIKNSAQEKRFSVRTMKPMTLQVPFNYWGSDCPDSLKFRGPVEYRPWVDETGTRSLEKCPPQTEE